MSAGLQLMLYHLERHLGLFVKFQSTIIVPPTANLKYHVSFSFQAESKLLSCPDYSQYLKFYK